MTHSFQVLRAADRTRSRLSRPERLRPDVPRTEAKVAFWGNNVEMSLPMQPLPMVERWSCHQCGVCCRGSVVPLSEDDVARLQSQRWEEHADFRGTHVMLRQSWLGHEYRLAHRDDGSCVFLDPDGLCRIHKELGFDAKPLVCRMFPLQIVPRDNVAIVTLRRACPSAAADKGTAVADQLDFARQLARERHLADAPPEPPPIKPGERREWRVTRKLLLALERLLTDERYPPVRRLVHALIFCRLLEQAKTRPMTDERLAELFGVLEQNVTDEVGELFSERQPPSKAAAVLFRQTAAEFARLHPRLIARPSWQARWNLAWAAWKFVRGAGPLPPMPPAFPAATFEQLEAAARPARCGRLSAIVADGRNNRGLVELCAGQSRAAGR